MASLCYEVLSNSVFGELSSIVFEVSSSLVVVFLAGNFFLVLASLILIILAISFFIVLSSLVFYSLVCIVLANLFLVVLSNLVCVVLAGLVLVVLKSTLRLPADNNEFVYPNPETLGSKQNLRQQKQLRPPRQGGLQDVQYLIIPIYETSLSVTLFNISHIFNFFEDGRYSEVF